MICDCPAALSSAVLAVPAAIPPNEAAPAAPEMKKQLIAAAMMRRLFSMLNTHMFLRLSLIKIEYPHSELGSP